jgi:hypothetical protein
MKIKSPCKNCTKRSVGCHSTCFGYIFYKARLRQFKQEESDYWHKHGYDPAEKERRRRLKAMWKKCKEQIERKERK